MSKRKSILVALADKLKTIDGVAYTSNLSNNAYPKLKFWDEVRDFPCVYSSAGSEYREYLPGDFAWVYLSISLKVYCKGEDSQLELEQLLEDIETVIDANRVLVYDAGTNSQTTEILVNSINTDEGLLSPYAVGEIVLQVRYAR